MQFKTPSSNYLIKSPKKVIDPVLTKPTKSNVPILKEYFLIVTPQAPAHMREYGAVMWRIFVIVLVTYFVLLHFY